ncbi:MAG: hypothetical protein LBD80_07360 [Tannerella sp.]|jgi:RimJ/RimL family protein N-acetyltransferase|nr:hypothetical protein [Tannerella sp.]
MKFSIRNTLDKDISLYQICFDDTEFHYFLFGDNNKDIHKFVSIDDNYLKYIISRENNHRQEDIAFVHFCYNPASQEYWFSGGIIPHLFNSGLGIYVAVAIISYFFKYNQNATVKAGTYKYNQRSLRMLQSLGFKILEYKNKEIILKLTFSYFNNEFVNKILKRIEINDNKITNNLEYL